MIVNIFADCRLCIILNAYCNAPRAGGQTGKKENQKKRNFPLRRLKIESKSGQVAYYQQIPVVTCVNYFSGNGHSVISSVNRKKIQRTEVNKITLSTILIFT